ncbi:MAG: OmpA family protein [Bacteroidota bacterium]
MQTTNTNYLLCFVLLLMPMLGQAQTKQDRWALSLGGGAIRYTSVPGLEQPPLPMYDPGIHLGATRYLRGGFDFRTQLAYVPQARIPLADGTRPTFGLIDMNYQLMFKFNNGVFMRESAFFAPYLVFGIGGSYASEIPDAYVPLGGGVRFRLGDRASLRLETVRKVSLNKQAEQLAHAVAFVYNLPGKERIPEDPQDLENAENLVASMIPQDRDQDGIMDIEDNCPDEPGVVRLNGCPENSTPSNTVSKSPVIAEESKSGDPLKNLEESLPKDQEELYAYAPLPKEVDPSEPMGKVGSLAELSMPAESTMIVYESQPEARQKEPQTATTSPSGPTNGRIIAEKELEEVVTDKLMKEVLSTNVRPEVDSPCGDFGVAEGDMMPIQFPTNSYSLESESYSTLDRIAEAMQSCPNINLVLEGHADAMGTDDDNLVLSVMRAYNVKYYLVYEHGISQKRILSKGKGETAPIADNESLQGRDQNRRVDFRFVF